VDLCRFSRPILTRKRAVLAVAGNGSWLKAVKVDGGNAPSFRTVLCRFFMALGFLRQSKAACQNAKGSEGLPFAKQNATTWLNTM
jgi:hypothetical protein